MRRRLNLLSLAVTSMMAIAFLIPLLGLVSDIARDRALDAAGQDAQLVAQLITATSDTRDPLEAFDVFLPEGILNGRPISVVASDGRSAGSPLPPEESLDAAFAGAASDLPVSGGRAVVVPAFQAGGEVSVVRVFVSTEELTNGVSRARSILIGLSIALVAIAVAITDRLARTIVGPVKDLSDASAALARGDLGARVSPEGPPEIREVGRQFNRMAGEVSALLQAERETAADLSHRLRTPLTAARLDAERISDETNRETIMADLDEIERNVDHAIGVLRAPGRAVSSGCVVEEVVKARADFWEALAAEQNRKATTRLPSTATAIGVAEDDLIAAVDALIGNVFSHTDEGVDYEVSVSSTQDSITVAVADAGAGFSDGSLHQRGVSAGGSTGLGLDIARRTAELTGGTMQIRKSSLGGAAVSLVFVKA